MRVAIALCLFLAVAQSVVGQTATNCLSINADDLAIFNILPYSKQANFVAKDAHYNAVRFSFCSPTVSACGSSQQVYGVSYETDDNTTCQVAAASATPGYHAYDPSNPGNGLSVVYPPVNGSAGEQVFLNVTFICDMDQTDVNGTEFTLSQYEDGNNLFLNVTGTSRYGCAVVTLGQFMAFLEKYKPIFVVTFFVLGIFINLFGLKMFNLSIFLITASAGTFVSGSLFYELTSFSTGGGVLWVVFGSCVLIGCILGYLAIKFEKVGFFGLGFALGVVAALFLYQGVLAPFLSGHGSAVLYVFAALLGLIGGGLALWIWKDIIIIATSLIGAYLSVRSVSVYIGGFPAETEVASGMANFSGIAYAYLVVIVILTIGGMFFQFKNKKRDEDEREEANPQNIYKNMMSDNGY